jgi:beta-galactosidase
MSRILATAGEHILASRRKAEVCVLFYPHYYATELERPETGNSDLVFNAASIRRPAFFDGVLKALQLLNVDYDMADLTRIQSSDLTKYRQVWSFSTDEMDRKDQQVLIDYMDSGGNLVMFPMLPDREMNQQPCTLLRDAVGIHPSGIETIDSPLIDIIGNLDVKCANPQVVYQVNGREDVEVIARTLRGTACGFAKHVGKGTIFHVGTWLGFDTEGHRKVYLDILKRSGAFLKNGDSDQLFLTVRERFAPDGKGLLFVANYYNEEHQGIIKYTHPSDGDLISIPYRGESGRWPALYGLITPLCLEIVPGLTLLHSTSDLLGTGHAGESVTLSLTGNRDLMGEMVFEGPLADDIASVHLQGEKLTIMRDGNRAILIYPHEHQKEQILELILKGK